TSSRRLTSTYGGSSINMEVQKNRANEEYVLMAEYRLLNALIHSKVFLDDSRVHERMFPHELAKSFYTAVVELHEQSVPITAASLHQKTNELDYNATLDVANQIIGIDVGADTLDDMVVVLNRAVQKREFNEKAQSIVSQGAKKGDLDTSQLMTLLYEAEQVLADTGSKQLLISLDEFFENYLEEFRERAEGRQYLFGDPLLDKALVKGAYPGAITIVAGSTGQGKSAYVLNLMNGMINQSIPCMYISLEMSATDTADRLLSMRREIPTSELYAPGEAMGGLIKVIEQEREELKSSNKFFFVEEPDLSLTEISALIKEHKQRTRSEYLVVAIDLLTQVRDFMKSASGLNLAQSMEQAMNKLNIIAKKENVHILGVVQFNRDADNLRIQDHDDLSSLRPTLNNVKNAQAIAERARALLGIFRPKYYADRYLSDLEETQYMDDIMEVQVLKQSNGATPRIKYEFDGEVFRVTPYVEEQQEGMTDEERQAHAVIEGNF
ncbi:MAG: AAA family ATPase, partial [Actinobacteria bacterium]|nr:AAA family ATPase [Actinomycetota bacterium]